MIQESIVTYLKAGLSNTRLYPDGSAPQNPTYPLTVWAVGDIDYNVTFEGYANLDSATFELVCFGQNQLSATNLANEVVVLIKALKDYKQTLNGTYVDDADIEGQFTYHNEASETYGHSISFTIYHR